MIKIFYIIIIVSSLLLLVYSIKNNVTYKNTCIIADAIYNYNLDRIAKGDLDGILSYGVIKSYDKAFYNIFDWGYKNLVSKDIYELIEPFIEEEEK